MQLKILVLSIVVFRKPCGMIDTHIQMNDCRITGSNGQNKY